jgi:aspartyl protease/PDZ domain-containing protein
MKPPFCWCWRPILPFTVAALLCISSLSLLASEDKRGPGDAEALCARARQVSGGNAWDKVSALAFSGSENSAGMQGNVRGVDDIKTGRIRRDSDFRVIKLAEVWDSRHHWRQDMSGGVHALNSEFALRANATDEWMARRAYLKPDAENARLGPVELRHDGQANYRILTATPLGGQPVELWFDEATGYLARSVREMPIYVETVNYAKYKDVGAIRLPYRITTDEGTGDVDTIDISDYQINPKIDDRTFQTLQVPNDTIVANGTASVPVEIGHFVTLEARLNGKGPYAFLFDTGGHAILTPEAATSLGLRPAGAGSSGGAGQGRLPVQYAKVDRMDIGGVAFKNQNFFVIPLQYDTVARGTKPPLAGILGLEILERLAVRLNYRNRTMTFWPREKYHHQGAGTAVPITFSDDIPLLRAILDGNPGDFALDTGNGGSLVIQHIWAEHHGLADHMKRGIEMVSFGSGGESHNWASRVSDFELANHSFHHVISRYAEDQKGAFSSRTEAGNIGAQILENFTLDFDYANSRIWFRFVPGYTPPPFSRSGMSLYQSDPQTVTVANVLKGGPAAFAGLEQGDTIIAIDGKRAAELTGEEVRDIFTQAPGTQVPIRYSRSGREAETAIDLKDLLP